MIGWLAVADAVCDFEEKKFVCTVRYVLLFSLSSAGLPKRRNLRLALAIVDVLSQEATKRDIETISLSARKCAPAIRLRHIGVIEIRFD